MNKGYHNGFILAMVLSLFSVFLIPIFLFYQLQDKVTPEISPQEYYKSVSKNIPIADRRVKMSLTGIVYDPEGNPISNCSLRVECYRSKDDQKFHQAIGDVSPTWITDENGRFFIEGEFIPGNVHSIESPFNCHLLTAKATEGIATTPLNRIDGKYELHLTKYTSYRVKVLGEDGAPKKAIISVRYLNPGYEWPGERAPYIVSDDQGIAILSELAETKVSISLGGYSKMEVGGVYPISEYIVDLNSPHHSKGIEIVGRSGDITSCWYPYP